jgi:hypothetical protein
MKRVKEPKLYFKNPHHPITETILEKGKGAKLNNCKKAY